jgi:hypothetical protein
LHRHRSKDVVDLLGKAVSRHPFNVEIDVLRIAQAVEEIAQVRAALEELASRVEAFR